MDSKKVNGPLRLPGVSLLPQYPSVFSPQSGRKRNDWPGLFGLVENSWPNKSSSQPSVKRRLKGSLPTLSSSLAPFFLPLVRESLQASFNCFTLLLLHFVPPRELSLAVLSLSSSLFVSLRRGPKARILHGSVEGQQHCCRLIISREPVFGEILELECLRNEWTRPRGLTSGEERSHLIKDCDRLHVRSSSFVTWNSAVESI